MKGTSPPRGCDWVVANGIKRAMMAFPDSSTPPEGEGMSIIVIGFNLAKNIFAVHDMNESGHAELVKPKVSPDQLLPLIAILLACRQDTDATFWIY